MAAASKDANPLRRGADVLRVRRVHKRVVVLGPFPRLHFLGLRRRAQVLTPRRARTSPCIAIIASQKRSSSALLSLSVGSTISERGTGHDIVGAWNLGTPHACARLRTQPVRY